VCLVVVHNLHMCFLLASATYVELFFVVYTLCNLMTSVNRAMLLAFSVYRITRKVTDKIM